MTQSAAGTCPTSCMIKKTVISAATIVMPRAHRKELTGLKALKGIGRRSPLCDSCIRKQPSSRLRPYQRPPPQGMVHARRWRPTVPRHGPATIPTPKQALMSPKWRARFFPIGDVGDIGASNRTCGAGDAAARMRPASRIPQDGCGRHDRVVDSCSK